ncbi:MAG: Sua5/YciO/YrdC/YwlC family protein, partial [Methylomonas sp.]
MSIKQLTIKLQGQIQGVGFRPFIFQLAHQFQQLGYVANHAQGVVIVIQGQANQQQNFLNALKAQLPPFAEIHRLAISETPPSRFTDFQIIPSQADGKPSAFIMPDLAPCPACLSDLTDTNSRFYRYPFTSCCHCGPRYSIIQAQPFDRANTSMAAFQLCPACEQDYQNPSNRRFHAQTLSCPACGPNLEFISTDSANHSNPIKSAIELLQAGKILALKGIGGFQLLVDGNNQAAVERLRQRKQRPYKPLALMVTDLHAAEPLGFISEPEQAALTSAAAPIVLLQRRATNTVAKAVAEHNQLLGIMLPASPLHYLIAQAIPSPLVVTSGNRHQHPLCIDNQQALSELAEIADGFLL